MMKFARWKYITGAHDGKYFNLEKGIVVSIFNYRFDYFQRWLVGKHLEKSRRIFRPVRFQYIPRSSARPFPVSMDLQSIYNSNIQAVVMVQSNNGISFPHIILR
jgi:hypothetical protein